MSPDDFSESLMQALADKLAPKLLAGMQMQWDLSPEKNEIKRAERLSLIAIIFSALSTFLTLGYILGAAFAIF